MGLLKKLMEKCKCGVFLVVNEHRDYYQSAQERLDNHYMRLECPPEIPEDVKKKMIELDTIIELQFYPDTPIGSYCILHWDLDTALDEALEIIKERGG